MSSQTRCSLHVLEIHVETGILHVQKAETGYSVRSAPVQFFNNFTLIY